MNSSVHLTEDQIDDHLIGDLAHDQQLHLVNCADCQARVAEIEAPIASFKDVSLAWSERHSATMSVRPAGVAPTASHNSRAIWAATAAAAAVIGVAIPLAHHDSVKTQDQIGLHAPSAPAQTFSAERDEQIAQDNQMLQAIDREIGAPVSSPSETFGLELADGSQHSVHAGAVRD